MGLVWQGEADEDDDTAIWPENAQAVEVFCAMTTQWRMVSGMGGIRRQGLDYQALPIVEQRCGIKRQERVDLFQRLRIMESAALDELNKAH